MITARLEPGKVPGIIGNSNDLFTDIKNMHDERFTEAQWKAVAEIESFSKELNDAVDSIMPAVKLNGKGIQPAVKGDGYIVFRELANRSPVFQFMNEDGQLSPEVKDAMSIAPVSYTHLTLPTIYAV